MRDHRPQSITQHLSRMPLHSQLDASQRALVELATAWHEWLDVTLPAGSRGQALLSHYANGKLVISCGNAVVASQIRHLQPSLHEFFGKRVELAIEQIVVRMEHAKPGSQHRTGGWNESIPKRDLTTRRRSALSNDSLRSISHCRKNVTNERLSMALRRLEKTLGHKP